MLKQGVLKRLSAAVRSGHLFMPCLQDDFCPPHHLLLCTKVRVQATQTASWRYRDIQNQIVQQTERGTRRLHLYVRVTICRVAPARGDEITQLSSFVVEPVEPLT